jgi:mannose-6-phosphate isomerase
MSIIFLAPVFKSRIWGGNKIKDVFNYDIPNDQIGECWAISGHDNGSSIVLSGTYKGMSLKDLYQKHKKEIFNNDLSDQFPLLIKILDANDDLSVQVHPDDTYALNHENEYGKTECWYVIDAKKDTKIIDGHLAYTKEEFKQKIKNNDLSLWHYRSIKKDDFIYIPSKTVHAIGKGAFIYEVQQSSDSTYRLYDYNRKDKQGNSRELHLDKALEVIDIPAKNTQIDIKVEKYINYDAYHYIKNQYFDLKRVDVRNRYMLHTKKYMLCSILEGFGSIDNINIKKGDHFIIPGSDDERDILIEGNLKIMMTKRP